MNLNRSGGGYKLGQKSVSLLKANQPTRALKPILPKLPNLIKPKPKPKHNYEILPEDSFNGYGTCYVCDALFYQGIKLWGKQPPHTVLASKIGALLGDNFAVVVSADDVLCQKCYSHLTHIDQLEEELKHIRQLLRGHLMTKYQISELPGEDSSGSHSEFADKSKRPIVLTGKRQKLVKTPQKCNMCGLQLDSVRALRKHNIMEHLQTWTCHFCNRVFKEEKSFTDHTKTHLTENTLQLLDLQQSMENEELKDLEYEKFKENITKIEDADLACTLCGVHFSNDEAYTEHMQTHQVLLDFESLDKPEALSLDGFVGNSESVDLMDMNIFDNSDSMEQTIKRFICADCESEHETREEMIIHMQTIHNRDPCYQCSEFYGTKSEIEDHIAQAHDIKVHTWLIEDERQPVACGFCNVLLEDGEFEQHEQECALRPSETIGKYEAESAEALALHQDLVNNEQEEEVEEELIQPKKKRSTNRPNMCIFCHAVFPNKAALMKHESENPTHVTMQCPDCESTFGRIKDLNEHRELVHAVITCRWCAKTFNNVKQTKAHEQRHFRSILNHYECEVCHRIFLTPTGLRYHMITHTGKYKHICEFCSKGFACKARYDEHRACHTKEKRYTCEICDAKFSVQATYWIHRKWHDNPKPYKCEECGMFFKHSSLLSVHKRKHTGERPYACTQCDQTFAVSNSLKRHMALHTGVFPYTCDSCNIGFPAKHKYAQHMSKVHDDDTLVKAQQSNKSRNLVMALKEKKPETEETWVLADETNESQHYLTLETEEGEKILLSGGGNQMVEIVLQDDQNMEIVPFSMNENDFQE